MSELVDVRWEALTAGRGDSLGRNESIEQVKFHYMLYSVW